MWHSAPLSPTSCFEYKQFLSEMQAKLSGFFNVFVLISLDFCQLFAIIKHLFYFRVFAEKGPSQNVVMGLLKWHKIWLFKNSQSYQNENFGAFNKSALKSLVTFPQDDSSLRGVSASARQRRRGSGR
ncbi:MAG: hypothetical protein II420_00990, partial [Oscillospiraceae bacterium]|nr:hypothetical protein [Oscillospiraceae bacterium]